MGNFIFWENDVTAPFQGSEDIDEYDRAIASAAKESGLPIWIDTARNRAERLVIADEGYVSDIVEAGNIYVIVIEPHASAKKIKHTDSDKLIEILRDSMENERMIVFAESEAFEILDAQIVPDAEPLYDTAPEDNELRDINSISEAKAKELFAKLANKSCELGASQVGCVPYMYPTDGCWGRAHSMYMDIKAKRHDCQKIWTYKSLSAATANSPRCRVWWGWHVAVTLKVTGVGKVVLDPSLFDDICSVKEWLKIQRGRSSDTYFTRGRVYQRSRSGRTSTDRTFRKTKKVLDRHRLKLLKQARRHGWPPYASCQVE